MIMCYMVASVPEKEKKGHVMLVEPNMGLQKPRTKLIRLICTCEGVKCKVKCHLH